MALWKFALLIGSLTVTVKAATSALRDGQFHGNMMPVPAIPRVLNTGNAPVISKNGTVLPPYNTTYYFDQLIDHHNPSMGTFKQRFWHTYEQYEAGALLATGRKCMYL